MPTIPVTSWRRWPWWRGQTVKSRLLAMVVAMMLPFFLLGAYETWRTLGAERERIARESVGEARERAWDLEAFVQGWRQTLGVLAASPAIQERRADDANALFANLLIQYPYLVNVAAVDSSFEVWASALPRIRGVKLSGANEERLRAVLQSGQPGLSDPTTLQVDRQGAQRTFVFLWHPIRDGEGRITGLLQLGLPLDTLHTALRFDALTPGRPVLVIHVNGTVLSGSNERLELVGANINERPLGQGMHGNQGTVEYVDENGVKQLAAYQKAPTLPWYAVVAIPSDEAFASLASTGAGIAGAVLAVALLALFFSRRLQAEIARPVGQLVEAAERLSSGDLAYRVKITDGGELAQVGAAFNQMASELEISYRDLEKRVDERTSELAAAQRELRALNADLQRQVGEQVGQLERASALKRYLSPRLAEHLLSGEEDVGRQTTRRNLSVLFADIRGFTSFSEEVEPEELIDILNEILSALTEIVFEYEGTLDKYLGDGLMAFFGDPVPYRDHAERAVRTAVAMRDCLVELQGRWFSVGQGALGVGIGITTGYVTVGTIGAPNRLEYTVIGNNVNLAARLSDQAAGGEILTSSKTLAAVKDLVQARSRGRVEIKGRRRSEHVFEILGLQASAEGPAEAAPIDLVEASRARRGRPTRR